MTGLSQEEKIARLRQVLSQAQRVAALTGAGVSAESGVPTFRGADGLWRQYRAVDLATPGAFAENPELVWEFYNWRRELLAKLAPNAAHRALVELERRLSSFLLITQNIDDLHRAAGSRRVLELHGNIWRLRCTGCGRVSEDRTLPLPARPACKVCAQLLRPDVVWFGEMVDPNILNHAMQALGSCEVLLIIGTSANVQPAASMGLRARRQGAFVAEINLEATPYSESYDLSILGKVGEIMPLLVH
ncbi:MAG TPA: NAD-dependent deacylase [Desulfobaccales bacterium]|nr:NAD-dependent deacylase [Desulfobaccales bacterium]